MQMAGHAKMLGPKMVADIANGFYEMDDIVYPELHALPGMTATGAGGIALTLGGSLKSFAPNARRIVPGRGFLREVASRNMLSGMNNIAPTTTGGWVLLNSRPAGATMTVVDDSAALYAATDPVSGEYIFRDLIDAGLMNGSVVRVYNPSATDDFAVPVQTLGPGTYSWSVYTRCIAGSASLSVTAGGGSTPDFSGPEYRRVGRNHVVAASGQARLTVRPLSEVYVILAQLEPGTQQTSPIAIAGLPAERKAESLFWASIQHLSRPCTVTVEVEFARLDSVERRIATVRNGKGAEIAVQRGTDNSLSCSQTNERWRPGFARCYGPGVLRFTLQISPMGRTLGMDGALTHDVFSTPPAGLSSLVIGADGTGGLPLNGWIRSIEVHGEVDEDELKELCEAPSGSIAFDYARYISMSGNNANDGRTPATAWRTLARAAEIDFALAVPTRSHVYLEAGGAWNETLLPVNYATYTRYGSGARPIIGNGQTNGVDENGASAWCLRDIMIFGANTRGVNSYGGSGIVADRIEMSYCGNPLDSNGGGFFIRGNTRAPDWDIAPTATSSGVTLTAVRMLQLVRRGTYHITCTVRGTGTASRWKIEHEDGAVIGTANGNTAFGGISNNFRMTVSVPAGVNPALGETFSIAVTELVDMPFPTNGLAEDVAIMRSYLHHIAGLAAGDDVYFEGVQGRALCISNRHDIPIGRAADCFQASLCSALYVAKPAHVICRNNYMSMAGAVTTSGKGGIVIISRTALVEGNYVYGLNFCISVNVDDQMIVRWNECEHARYESYSWGIGIGGNTDNARIVWYENVVSDCNRAYVISGTGALTLTLAGVQPRLQHRKDVFMYRNLAVNCGDALYIDRPWGGRIFRHTNDNCIRDATVTAAATTVAGVLYPDQRWVVDKAA